MHATTTSKVVSVTSHSDRDAGTRTSHKQGVELNYGETGRALSLTERTELAGGERRNQRWSQRFQTFSVASASLMADRCLNL